MKASEISDIVKDRLDRVDASLAKQLQRSMERNAQLSAQIEAVLACSTKHEERIAELLAQLPDGMKDRAIVFEECPKGHGSLRATNWAKQPCVHCRIQKQQDALRYIANNATGSHPANLRKVAQGGLEP